jgi:hypothetical protein
MDKKFEIGKSYECANFRLKPIKIINRTKRTVTADDSIEVWKTKIKKDDEGDEYVQKSTKIPRHRGVETYSASWEIEE